MPLANLSSFSWLSLFRWSIRHVLSRPNSGKWLLGYQIFLILQFVLFLRQTFCTFFPFMLRVSTLFYSLLALFNVKGVCRKMQYFLMLVIYTKMWFLIFFSSYICTSCSSCQEVMQWKIFSPNQQPTAMAVTWYEKLFVAVTVWFQVLAMFCKAPWAQGVWLLPWAFFLGCNWAVGSSAGFLLVKAMLSREGCCLWETLCVYWQGCLRCDFGLLYYWRRYRVLPASWNLWLLVCSDSVACFVSNSHQRSILDQESLDGICFMEEFADVLSQILSIF